MLRAMADRAPLGIRLWGKRLRHRRVRAPWYAEVLAGIALSYPDCCYIEIGVEHGISLAVVAPASGEAHACDIVDRSPAIPSGVRFWHMGSDDFFERYAGP